MKYQLKDLLDQTNILSHIFLNCVTTEALEKIAEEGVKLAEEGKTHKEIMERGVEIELTVNGKSINPKKFFDLFNDQHTDCVKRQATELVKEQLSEKFSEISDKLEEYKKVTEQWAEDINWNTENLLLKKINHGKRKFKHKTHLGI